MTLPSFIKGLEPSMAVAPITPIMGPMPEFCASLQVSCQTP